MTPLLTNYRFSNSFFSLCKRVAILCVLFLLHGSFLLAAVEGQWSVEKINTWYEKQPWIVGCNFLPSTAINDVEMWQDETFDSDTIDRELALAKKWGMNSVRVFINYVVWEAEPEKLKSNFRQFLEIADKHEMCVMPILFDDCNFSGNVAKIGKQQEPVPGVHNSGWVSSPSIAVLNNQAEWPKLKTYLQDMLLTFGKDERIIIWDLYNEPGNNGLNDINYFPLVKQIFAWAREVEPMQPLTIGAWLDFDDEKSKILRELSDIVSFHAYDDKDGVLNKIKWCHSTGRPAVCTEWLLRQQGNTPGIILPIFKENSVGSYNWGLVAGRTQTYFSWGSLKDSPMPKEWQHDLIRPDGTPYDHSEFAVFQEITSPNSRLPIGQ